MDLLGQDMATIPRLVAVNGHQDLQAAQIIILHLLEDIPLHPTRLVHRDHVAQHGLHSSQDLWDLQEVLLMVQLPLLHRVLMICTTGQDGPSPAMEAHAPHIQAKTLQVTDLVKGQYHHLARLRPSLQEAHHLHILYRQQAEQQVKVTLRIPGKLLTLINTRYVTYSWINIYKLLSPNIE